MPEYLSPGVYMEEVDKGPKPIEGVGTAMPVFIGFTEKAYEPAVNGRLERHLSDKLELVTSWPQYQSKFGSYVSGAYLPQSVEGYFANGGTRCYVISVRQLPPVGATLKSKAGGFKVSAINAGVPDKPLHVRVVLHPSRSPIPKPQTPPKPKDKDPKPDPKLEDVTALPLTPAAAPADSSTASQDMTLSDDIANKDNDKIPQDGFRIFVFQHDAVSKKTTVLEKRDYVLEQASDTEVALKMIFSSDANQKQLVRVQFAKDDDGRDQNKGKVADLIPLVGTFPLTTTGTETESPALLAPAEATDFKGGDVQKKNLGMQAMLTADDITMVVVPDLMTVMPPTPSQDYLNGLGKDEKAKALDDYKKGREAALEKIKSVQTAMVDICTLTKDKVAILDTPPNLTPQDARDWRMNTTGFDSSYATMYYPWIEVMDPITNRKKFMPPSGHIAGVWARSDNTRGVHKAPANEVVRGCEGLAYYLTKGEHDTLNPINLNCIRQFPGMGYRVWGARTLSSVSSWKYLNIRRLFNFVEKSIERGTQWVVFEPNDPSTWARLRRDVNAFLMGVWRNGALFGLTPEQAFFVKCDESLNPPESRREGKLIIEIGMAPVYPAEFVIFRISQWAPGEEG
jgi:phage tail sheath protein FI